MSEQVRPPDERNRRTHVRHGVRLDGELRAGDAPARPCTVYDLGLQGVAVAVRETGRRRPAGALPVPGTSVSVRLPLPGAERAARVNGDVRWAASDTSGQRFGLHFQRCNRAAFDLLLDGGADLGPQLGARPGTPAGASLADSFPRLGGSYLRWLFEHGQALLLEAAENADDDATCALLAHAAIELWNARGRLSNAVLEHVRTHLVQHPPLPAGHAPSLPVAVMDEGLHTACRRHFATPAHVAPATQVLRRCVRESVAAPVLPRPRRARADEIVLGRSDLDPEDAAGRPGSLPFAAAG